jgi:hypothetical protein
MSPAGDGGHDGSMYVSSGTREPTANPPINRSLTIGTPRALASDSDPARDECPVYTNPVGAQRDRRDNAVERKPSKNEAVRGLPSQGKRHSCG